MTALTCPLIKHVSHQDFVKVLQWTLIEQVHGSYADQIEKIKHDIAMTKAVHGYVPRSAYFELQRFRREWSRAAYNARYACVDTSTGEMFFP